MPGPLIGARDTAESKVPALTELIFQEGRKNEEVYIMPYITQCQLEKYEENKAGRGGKE